MRKIRIWSAMIAVLGCIFLLMACKAETKTAVPTQNTAESSALPTDEPLDDPNIRYFTLEDFSSIVVGKSTFEDVCNITKTSSIMGITHHIGICEYPMREGKCVRIEFNMPDWVVGKIEVASPTLQYHSGGTNIDSVRPIGFYDYESYIAFFRGQAAKQPFSDIYNSKEIKAYIQDIRDGKLPLMIPYHGGKPVDIVLDEATLALPIQIYSSMLTCSIFDTAIKEKNIRLCISALPEEDATKAMEMTCSELIAKLKPSNPNLGNYDSSLYDIVFEDTAVIDGVSRSMLVQQGTNDMERIFFVMDGCLIEIYAPTGTVTKEWLKDFSIEPA